MIKKRVEPNLMAAWVGIFLGFPAGAVPGLFFHKDEWLGGYSSWRRRMLRLAHISFFGIGFINLAFALTTKAYPAYASRFSSTLLIAGGISMPLICYLAAWKKFFRNLFFIPVSCLIAGVGIFLLRIIST